MFYQIPTDLVGLQTLAQGLQLVIENGTNKNQTKTIPVGYNMKTSSLYLEIVGVLMSQTKNKLSNLSIFTMEELGKFVAFSDNLLLDHLTGFGPGDLLEARTPACQASYWFLRQCS